MLCVSVQAMKGEKGIPGVSVGESLGEELGDDSFSKWGGSGNNLRGLKVRSRTRYVTDVIKVRGETSCTFDVWLETKQTSYWSIFVV